MAIWAIGDLHLAFGNPEKSMEVFGSSWKNYAEKIEKNWRKSVKKEDLVLIPGDVSWSQKLEDALVDLKWIDSLPGTKILLKGNHDYWWPSNKKLTESLPPSIHFINNNVFNWNNVTIGGSRLWDTEEYSFENIISFQKNSFSKPKVIDLEKDKKTFNKELKRLEISLEQLNPHASLRIAMTHYPPIDVHLENSQASKLLEKFGIHICIFGHLHSIKKDLPLFGEKSGIKYFLTSADYLNFDPLLIKRN